MNPIANVAVTGMGIEIPGISAPAQLLTLEEPLPPGEFDPIARLGRKGLLSKDRATRLALCAVQLALERAGLFPLDAEAGTATGVVVSSNLGNADTVCKAVDTIHSGSVEDLSPLDTPNASSNIIASTIAIRYGLRSVNLMLCNGATSGIDALYLSYTAIRTGRARRMVVVGVEPRNQTVTRLLSSQTHNSPLTGEGAACLILEAESLATGRNARVLARISGYEYISREEDLEQTRLSSGPPPSLWLTPNQAWPEARATVDRLLELWSAAAPPTIDLSRGLGDLYGALGVVQGAAACLWLQGRPGSVLSTAGLAWGDGLACLHITA